MILEARGLTKRFGALVALDGVDLTAKSGEVHAVLGENGAGKSTLMNVLFGALAPDAGELRWDGGAVRWRSSAEALRAGIGMVHQHFTLVPALTVWENIWLAHPKRPAFSLDALRAKRLVRDLAERFDLPLDLDTRVEDLPVGARQRVEIAKSLAREPRLLILDEPTAVLAPQEVDDLFRGVRRLQRAGTAVVFISHKLDEVLDLADRITVLRRGRVAASCLRSEATVPQLTRSIVGDGESSWARRRPRYVERELPGAEGKVRPGRAPSGTFQAKDVPAARVTRALPLLEVDGLCTRPHRGGGLHEVAFAVKPGELLGVAGVDGNGQDELVAALAGLAPAAAGRIRVAGEDVTRATPGERFRRGLSVLPGDRSREGLALDVPLWENLALREFGAPWAREGALVAPEVHRVRAAALLRRHDVRAEGPHVVTRRLSGGNQQKVLFARELAADPRVLVLLNPTRGLDVGAADSLLRHLVELAESGRAVVLISTELEEVLAHASRVAVLRRGRWFDAAERDRAAVGALMVGGES